MTAWDFRTYQGFLDMGRDPLTRPQPLATVLEDRTDGVQYLLSHDTDTDDIVMETPVPGRVEGTVPPTEPLIRAGNGTLLRLYMEDGELLYEEVDEALLGLGEEKGLGFAPLFTVNPLQPTTVYRLSAEEYETFGDPLCVEKWSGLGTAVEKESLGCALFVVTPAEVFQPGVFEPGVFV